jgi:hypothetical protein
MLVKKAIVIWLALALLGSAGLACSKGGGKAQNEFPSYVYASALSLESYKTAVSLPREVTTQMPCYCGCADFPTPHRHLLDCFINPDGTYTDHASGCDLCGKIVLDVAAQHKQGLSIKEIRANIDAKYSVYGKSTDTPLLAE